MQKIGCLQSRRINYDYHRNGTLVILRNKQGGDNMAVSTMNILIICITILLFAIITKDDKNDKDGEE